ncbi:hypothetical protein QYE76_038099 [Lolium multiflorum]|uniref:Mitochondrial protein n=1 Tax=Lolium multiflorum TaxID=4521 RepID=A0AAD8WSL1_LOLMU|nr:hypothetical protein QYE76_038099 [Lolium multiflorum]
MTRCSATGPGSWFSGTLTLTSSPANGSSSTSLAPTVLLSATRLVGSCAAFGNALASTSRIRLPRLSNRARSARCCTLPPLAHGGAPDGRLQRLPSWPFAGAGVLPAAVDTERPDNVCLLSRSLYGLKQAPRAVVGFLHQLGFRSTRSMRRCSSPDRQRHGLPAARRRHHPDGLHRRLLRQLTDSLRTEFALKDLGPLHYFLGIELLERAGMLNCNPAPTPVDTKAKLSASDGSMASDAPFYRSIVGALQYLTLTRPEVQYAMQQVCLHMHAPRDAHWAAVKRILRYVCGTMGYDLSLHA